MRKWTRWQDWVALVVGVYALLSPIWTSTSMAATWTMVILGVLSALAALWSLAMPENVISEYVHAAFGVLFFLSPWVMRFTDMSALAATAWIAGVLTFIVGVWGVPMANKMHRTAMSH